MPLILEFTVSISAAQHILTEWEASVAAWVNALIFFAKRNLNAILPSV
jgi:hypothetical protein